HMNPIELSLSFFALIAASALLPGCASTKSPGEITKVKYYHLTSDTSDQAAVDPMVRFERRYYLHGQVTLEEQKDQFGSYYTVFWKATNRSEPAVLRFEYTQQSTGPDILTRDYPVGEIKRSNITRFAVGGDDIEAAGRITSWKISLLQADEVVATSESFLWD
ncbi:MAG: hypothetical protein ACC661_00355, partial [Verrucomicrobiales bacterium]